MTGARCTTCRKPITGKPGRVLHGSTRRLWCGGGATYTTRTRYECAPCWEAFLSFEAASRAAQAARDQAAFAAALAQLGQGAQGAPRG